MGPPRGFGDPRRMATYIIRLLCGENGYLFSGSWGSTGYYFRGAREQAHNFGDIRSLAKKQKNKEKTTFCLIF